MICNIVKPLLDDFWWLFECPRFVSFLCSYSARPVQLKAASKAPCKDLEKVSCTQGPIFDANLYTNCRDLHTIHFARA